MDLLTMFKGISMLVIFLGFVALMVSRKIPTILALPLMAIIFAVIAGVPFMSNDPEKITIFKSIVQQGSSRMADAMAGLIFGAWFAQVLNRLGITKGIVKKAAELGSGKPLVNAILFFIVTAVIFTGGSGLGMYILVGNIVIPIMISTGVSAFNAGLVLLLGGTMGSMMNVTGWVVMEQTLGVSIEVIRSNIWIPFLSFAVICLILIVFSIQKDVGRRKTWSMSNDNSQTPKTKRVPMLSFISPLIPVLLVFAFSMDIIPAIIISILVALIVVRPKRPMQVLSSGLIEGIQDVASPIALFIGIGMLLSSVSTVEVSGVIAPILNLAIPTTAVGYILFFVILSPLAIYRGPLALYGLGAGIGSLMIPGGMSPAMVFIGMQAIGVLQGISDPTQSYIVWIADFTRTDVIDYLKKTLFWCVAGVAISIIVGVIIAL
ncbi:citrate transporter [Vagococcus sp. BWB3-3]|uniref:Citrate transporter n=1 Tax=Vagococcus allomyrinae TaxID=2794353 RepID=A0A940PCM4_9ENTE|nr:citrate transporter [Vagococcus allomyrinae]MBP1040283.1 citrate transporter [Vagococcus allomyrinae]